MEDVRIDCRRCAHYFVTWDPCYPHGCRRMRFKSRTLPAVDVRQATPGHECLLFQAKTLRNRPAPNAAPAPAHEGSAQR